MHDDGLARFHPLIGTWFCERVGTPTAVQREAWPRIAAGEHVLVSAPTGSGKTLTAFLWALDRLIRGDWEGGAPRVLYVSPLKAVNNDVQRNLIAPLAELRERFDAAGVAMPTVRVLTRSGDTPQIERQRMARKPPEVLITTPESLNILLTSRRGRAMLDGLRSVILDEVHAVAGSKRGVHLITGIERLVLLAGEFQRIALSATVEPPDRIARWIGGYELTEAGGEPGYRARPVRVVDPPIDKRYELTVRYARDDDAGPSDDAGADDEGFWTSLTKELRRPLGGNRSTLIFANSRRKVEKVARLLNEKGAGAPVYSHHGSLSRELRTVVEQRFKAGELSAIVATNSLELGIDIGTLDEVLLVQTPPSIASAVQRLGRAGHGVGETSRGRLFPLYARDLLGAAVVSRCVLDGEIEPLEPVRGALDVLAQIVVSMSATERWHVDELYAVLRATAPYHELPRRHFDLVLEMLAGRYSAARVRELQPLVSIDRVDRTVRARPGAERRVYLAGGTIPDRGYFTLRHAETMGRIGELDEEFVWERSVGDTFTLGVQTWRVQRITHNDVLVVPARAASAMAPFWRAEDRDSSSFLAERVALFLERADGRLDDEGFRKELIERHHLHRSAADSLLQLLRAQQAASGGTLPHRHNLVVERIADPQSRDGVEQLIVHTLWGGRVNRPLALALAAAWQQRTGEELQVDHDNDCVVLRPPAGIDAAELLALVDPGRLEALLRQTLERTGFFGALFREAAGRSLLLPRHGFRQRMPLWLSRLKAKKLLDAVRRFDDFPLLLEGWRSCLQDRFELDTLATRLDEVARGDIEITQVTSSSPSPFASNVVWKQTNELMYDDDAPGGGGASGLRPDLLRELVFSAQLRPRLSAALVVRFERKLRRLEPGYAPRDAAGLLDWVVERTLIPDDEWSELLGAVRRDHEVAPETLLGALASKLVRLRLPGASGPSAPLVCAVESVPRVMRAYGAGIDGLAVCGVEGDPLADGVARVIERLAEEGAGANAGGEDDADDALTGLIGDVLRFRGPVDLDELRARYGLDAARELAVIEPLQDDQRAVVDLLTDDARELQVCDVDNLERLLRIGRAELRPVFETMPLETLPQVLASQQALAGPVSGIDGLRAALERLFGFAAPAEVWEQELLPARLEPYHTSWLDALLVESDLLWIGAGKRKLTFLLEGDRELIGGDRELIGGDEDRGGRAAGSAGGAAGRNATAAEMRDSEAVGTLPRWDGEAADGALPGVGRDRDVEGGLRPRSLDHGLGHGERPTGTDLGHGSRITEDGHDSGNDHDLDPPLLPDGPGRYGFAELAEHTGLDSGELTRRLWAAAWAGDVTNDGFAAVRQGIASGFGERAREADDRRGVPPGTRRTGSRPAGRGSSRLGGRRGRFARWSSARPFAGAWLRLPPTDPPADALEREELGKDRARLVLDRYGVVFRELLTREPPPLQWRSLFRALRIMELSGEVVGGQFLAGIAGLQFATPATVRRLQEGLPDDRVSWMNAVDPASPCGLGLLPDLPRRLPSNHLVYHGAQLVAVSERRGKRLTIHVAPDHPSLPDYLAPLAAMLTRAVAPLPSIRVETINETPAPHSPYRAALERRFRVTGDPRALMLARKY